MRRIALAVLMILLAGLVLLALAWWVGSRRQPEDAAAGPAYSWSVAEARRELELLLQSGGADGGPSHLTISEDDLRRLLIVTLAEHPDGGRILPAVKEVLVEVGDGEVRLGLSVDLSRLSELELTAEQRQAASAIEKLLLLLGQQDVYLGIRGVPRADEGQIGFGPDTRVRVGALELSPESFSDRFGLAREKLDRGVSLEIPGYEVREIEILQDALRLSVVAAS